MILDTMATSKKGSKSVAPDGLTMVKYGGTVIDIANLLKQVQKADQERSMAEKKIESLEKQIGKDQHNAIALIDEQKLFSDEQFTWIMPGLHL